MKLAWSNLARQVLEDLRRYSVERCGVITARHYLEDIRDAAKAVAQRPERARLLQSDFRTLSVRSHYLILHLDLQGE